MVKQSTAISTLQAILISLIKRVKNMFKSWTHMILVQLKMHKRKDHFMRPQGTAGRTINQLANKFFHLINSHIQKLPQTTFSSKSSLQRLSHKASNQYKALFFLACVFDIWVLPKTDGFTGGAIIILLLLE